MTAVGTEQGVSHEVSGVRLAAVKAGIRYADRLDLVLIEIAPGSQSAAVFTGNAFCAAPVIVARENVQRASTRYLLINTGNANAGTGSDGVEVARRCCDELATLSRCRTEQVLPFSTGVIGEPLPVDRLLAAMPGALEQLDESNWLRAAQGIMTTDTKPKLVSRSIDIDNRKVAIGGIAKGAGMIRPNMATMLAFIFTDAEIEQEYLQTLLRESVEDSFNRLTVDGDTSTNDSCVLTATGGSGAAIGPDHEASNAFRRLLGEVFRELATALIRDAEGATKFVSVIVTGGTDSAECLRVAYTVAESPLVKTAFFASDPNWGRILAAVGRSEVEALDLDKVTIHLGATCIVSGGGRDRAYTEESGQREMAASDIEIIIDLGRGKAQECVFTSDLSHDYVRINAEYRT